MTYQDAWVNGACVKRGYRECSSRYAAVRDACFDLPRDFRVCDIGANMCYFGLRLAEDFPLCRVTAFEFDSFEMRTRHLGQNAVGDRIDLWRKRVSLADVQALASVLRFDVVLALSVLHHVPEPIDFWIPALRKLGRRVIVELAGGDSRRANAVAPAKLPDDWKLIGLGKSHLRKGALRPIIMIPGDCTDLTPNAPLS